MYTSISNDGIVELCLLDDEFGIIKSVIIELDEEFHKPNRGSTLDRMKQIFFEKFDFKLEENDLLRQKLAEMRKDNQNIFRVQLNLKLYNFFVKALNEIIRKYEYYEFQIITGFKQSDVEQVLKQLLEIKL